MLDVDQRVPKDRPSSLAQWVYQAIGQPGVGLRVRVRGNNLHVLCESRQSLEAKTVVNRLIEALKGQDGGTKFPIDPGNPIYQIIIYGRTLGQDRPDWIKQIRIKSSQNPNAKGHKVSATSSVEGEKTDPTLIVSNESLARSGSPEAIARYLSETLSPLGVSVKVLIQDLTKGEGEHSAPDSLTPSLPERRLWVVCNSNYSPDASLLAEPVVGQLRNLRLKGFRDAAICSQVSGETQPEWMLRVDLTPPEVMLKEWAGWGDVQALSRLLNQELLETGLEVRAVLKDVTLHLFCSRLARRETDAPDKQTTVNAIAPILDAIAPQGIHAATIYGVESHQRQLVPEQEKPVWIEWLNLSAAKNPALAESAFSLAQQGNKDALTFLLQRLLHPDLDKRLATGGIQLKIRRKQDLLHIMSEAPLCPPQAKVGPPITKFLRQLAIPEIAGVRVYGRRAGATSPSWNYGVDFAPRRRLVPEATPEFAASDAYVNELVAPTEEPILRPELTQEDLKDGLTQTVQATTRTIQRWLCRTQLFVPLQENQELQTVTRNPSLERSSSSQGVLVAIVWGTLGLLLTFQADRLIGEGLRVQGDLPTVAGTEESPSLVSLPDISLQKDSASGAGDFNTSSFTRTGEASVTVNNEEPDSFLASEKALAARAALASARSPNPSFNNPLLDEKLALYQQRLLQNSPPDVLIVGSSRALRGVDPVALQDALAAQGYPDIEVFNFGVNGATAQVVDLLIRQILTPEQLPKLIVWADGARAFNSGRVDVTYNAIANSEGYQHLKAGTFPTLVNTNQRGKTQSNQSVNPFTSLSASYQAVSDWLNKSLATVSSTYPQRDQLKLVLRERFAELLQTTYASQEQTSRELQQLSYEESIDFDGFLPLSVRYNPVTYYQNHPRVPGEYDGDYQSFQLDGKQNTALGSLLQFTQANDIDIVFVNLPLTKDYLDPARMEYEEQFQRYMRTLALEKGLIFRDLNQLLPTKHDYFSDPSHLNRYGAYEVSKRLAQDPMIPWQSK